MKKVLVIAGPTASGKTAFSIELAKELGCEIISGDSIQVYKGMDIGSGKIREDEKQGIPHYLIDILNPNEQYSVAQFQAMARSYIEQIEKPMIVGGTGLYLKSCLYDYTFFKEDGLAIVDEDLEHYSNEALYEMLQKSDPVQAQKIHPNNRRRLLRSLTKARRSGESQSEQESHQTHQPIYDVWIAGCTMPREILYERINARVEQMFAEGLQKEVEGLLQNGYTFADAGMHGIGYQEWKDFYDGEKSIEEVKTEIQKHSRQYAKKQYTWFNHQMDVHWFNVLEDTEQKQMKEDIKTWWKQD